MCLWTAKKQFGFKLDVVVFDDDNDARTIHVIEYLAEPFRADYASGSLDTDAFSLDLTLQLEVSEEQAGFLPTLIERGLHLEEALTTVAGSNLVDAVKPSLKVRDILPSGWQWKG